MKFRFESEIPPVVPMRLKIETNCREHFAILGWQQTSFSVESNWYTGSCNLTTYTIEELLGTKIRALYQRKKGRDLYDLYHAFIKINMDKDAVIACYKKYMEFSVGSVPSQKGFLLNIEEKIGDEYFIGDIIGLIRPIEDYDQSGAFRLLKKELIERMY